MRQIAKSDTQVEADADVYAIIRPDGTVNKKDEPKISPEDLVRLYRLMVLNRNVDERVITLQRQGRIGFFIGSVGEEAAIIGSAFALEPKDWVYPCYREMGAALLRGMPLEAIMNNLFGNAADPVKGRQMPCHYFDRKHNFASVSSPIGTQISQATGTAMAAKFMKQKVVALTYFGDGATSSNDFHVGVNFAGVYKAPVIFLCRNNQWAISVPREMQTAAETISQKAIAYGIEGVRVDGNDLLAVYKVTKDAADKARAGRGPTLIEAVTYRQGGHSTSDDPRAYRQESEVEAWRRKDPLLKMRAYLEKRKLWDEAQEERLQNEAKEQVLAAVAEAEKIGPPPADSLFDDVFAELPPHLVEQREDMRQFIAEFGPQTGKH